MMTPMIQFVYHTLFSKRKNSLSVQMTPEAYEWLTGIYPDSMDRYNQVEFKYGNRNKWYITITDYSNTYSIDGNPPKPLPLPPHLNKVK